MFTSFTTEPPMRTIKVHPENSINFTKEAKFWTEMTNAYKKCYPKHSFKQMAEHFDLSETNCRRYYYGVHHFNPGMNGYTQVRLGACVAI
jgi:hypothetical protein